MSNQYPSLNSQDRYPDLPDTNFPHDVDNFDPFQDPTIEDLGVINQYYNYIKLGQLDLANQLLTLYPNLNLDKKIINAYNLNKLREGVIAVERFFYDSVDDYLFNLVSFKGAYSSTTLYGKYNVVSYNGMSYMYINDTSGKNHVPTNTTYWIPLSVDIDKVFIATYNLTTSAEIEAAYQAGKMIFVKIGADCGVMDERENTTVHHFVVMNGSSYINIVCSNDVWSFTTQSIQPKITANGILKGDGNGGVTAAVSGTDYQTPLPSQTGNSGKFLTTDGTDVSWAAAPTEIFWCTYGTTTSAEITAAVTAGKIPACIYDDCCYIYAERTSSSHMFTAVLGAILQLYCSNEDAWQARTLRYQKEITANGVLKGNGSGGVTAAVAGTDYQTPLTAGTDYQTPLPSQSGNSGKFLTTNGTSLSWGNIPEEIFIATYGTTTFDELQDAYSAGKYIICEYTTHAANARITYNNYAILINRSITIGTTIDPVSGTETDYENGVYYRFICSNFDSRDNAARFVTFGYSWQFNGTEVINSSWDAQTTHTSPSSDSPDLTGTPTAPTAAEGTDTNQIATTRFVRTAINTAINDAIGGAY